MKRIIIILALIVGLSSLTESKSQMDVRVYGSFYSHLAPYGIWMQFDDGLVVWRPTIMRSSWAPYSIGRWIWTEYGWYWDSYESFGYITYHYGRWFYDDYYGWIWIPDYDWAPAWVEWRYDDLYIGWAPLPPYAVFSVNLGIHFTFNFVTPYTHWHFVSYKYVCDPYVYNHYVAPKYKYRVFSNTKYRNDYGYSNGRIINRGVDIGVVKTRSGQDIRQRTIQQISDPRELTRSERDIKMESNKDVVRTYIPSKEELRTDNVRDFTVRKVERNSSLEASKLQIGDRNKNDNNVGSRNRENEPNVTVKERDIKEINKSDVEGKRSQERINIERNQETKTLNDRQKLDNSTLDNRNLRNDVEKNRSVQKENQVERNAQIQREQKEVKVEKKVESNTSINRNSNREEIQHNNASRSSNQRINQERTQTERTKTR